MIDRRLLTLRVSRDLYQRRLVVQSYLRQCPRQRAGSFQRPGIHLHCQRSVAVALRNCSRWQDSTRQRLGGCDTEIILIAEQIVVVLYEEIWKAAQLGLGVTMIQKCIQGLLPRQCMLQGQRWPKAGPKALSYLIVVREYLALANFRMTRLIDWLGKVRTRGGAMPSPQPCEYQKARASYDKKISCVFM